MILKITLNPLQDGMFIILDSLIPVFVLCHSAAFLISFDNGYGCSNVPLKSDGPNQTVLERCHIKDRVIHLQLLTHSHICLVDVLVVK